MCAAYASPSHQLLYTSAGCGPTIGKQGRVSSLAPSANKGSGLKAQPKQQVSKQAGSGIGGLQRSHNCPPLRPAHTCRRASTSAVNAAASARCAMLSPRSRFTTYANQQRVGDGMCAGWRVKAGSPTQAGQAALPDVQLPATGLHSPITGCAPA